MRDVLHKASQLPLSRGVVSVQSPDRSGSALARVGEAVTCIKFITSYSPLGRLHAMRSLLWSAPLRIRDMCITTPKPKGTKALPFVHILQYKEEELVQQSVVCRCSKEGSFG
jgi:hypothetical protein